MIRSAAVVLVLVLLTTGLPAQERGTPEQQWERFLRSDQNGDGRLSREESPFPPKAFERIDADGDGVVTKEEFLARWATGARRPRPDPAPKEGAAAPDFTLTRADTGKPLKLSELLGKGRPVVLLFGSFT
jgi:hypothetical protein